MATAITKTVGSDGGDDYSTVAAAVAALPASLVTADESWTFRLRDEVHTVEEVDITSTTDSDRFVRFEPMTTAHGGFRSSSGWLAGRTRSPYVPGFEADSGDHHEGRKRAVRHGGCAGLPAWKVGLELGRDLRGGARRADQRDELLPID